MKVKNNLQSNIGQIPIKHLDTISYSVVINIGLVPIQLFNALCRSNFENVLFSNSIAGMSIIN
jgi:hypothetical protein